MSELSRRTLELCRNVVAAQMLHVGHPSFFESAVAHSEALDELDAALAVGDAVTLRAGLDAAILEMPTNSLQAVRTSDPTTT